MSSEILLEARELNRRSRDGKLLLDCVSIQIRAGDRWAVSGPAGAGKTLFLRALTLLDEIESGTILLRGEEIVNEHVPRFRREVIYLHQRPVLAEGTVEQNLRAPYSFKQHHSRAYDRARVVEYLQGCGQQADFLDKPSSDLSGGESQIAAILRAVQLQPSILLLDEPTAALDAASTAAIEKLIAEWQNEARDERAFIWISHDPDQIQRITDKRILMKNGQAEEQTDVD